MKTSKHIICSFLSKLCSIGAQCYSLAIITKAFDKQDMGLWLLFFHSVFFFSFFDLGLGGSYLLNRLLSFQKEMTCLEKTANFFFEKFLQTLFIYSVGFIFLTLFSLPLTQHFFSNIKYHPEKVQSVFLIFSLFQLARFPLNFWAQALMAYEKGYAKSLLEICENCGLILLASMLFYLKAPLFASLITCAAFSFSISLIFFLITIKHLRWGLPKISLGSLYENLWTTFKECSPFWIQNLLSTLLFSCSPFLFNSHLGMDKGSNYALSFKICSLVIGIHLAFITPLTPFYRILHERHQHQQAEKKLIQSLSLSLISLLVVSCLMYAFVEPMLKFWTKRDVIFYFDLVPWMILYSLINVFSVYLNALGKVNRQNLFLLLGLAVLTSIILVAKDLDKNLIGYASSVALIPLLFSNIFDVLTLNSLSRNKKTQPPN